jgi:hypothetical protein
VSHGSFRYTQNAHAEEMLLLTASALALQLCEALSSMTHQSLSTLPVNWEATTWDIKQGLQWWQETVDSRLRAIVEQIAASSTASTEKKRRRPSGNIRNEQ